jgi:hypothetical protein
VVCAPTNQGKTVAGEFLIHGNHTFRPERSLKIDATNMKNFSKDCATFLKKCPAAADSLALLLCQALAGTNTNADATGELGLMIPSDTLIEMRDANHHDVLTVAGEDGVPCPILILDEFYCETKENVEFIRTLYKEASSLGVIVFIMTTDKKWATS